ncbi:leucine zipper domain-containing protein [Aeromonas sp. Y318-1]|uniref:leucine zipper domain-containing protein n=1 Tax=Aeromonas sp. Y318-1 TaxID=2990508 RepID=UPI003FA4B843
MNNHKNARLTLFGRQLLVRRILEQGLRVEEAAHAAGVSTRTATSGSRDIARRGLMGCTIALLDPHSVPMPSMTSDNR